MMRKFALFIIALAFCTTAAWPKFKEDDQKYLDDQFRTVLEQAQQLATQIQTLNAQLTELRQNQAQFQAVIIRQQRALQEMEQMVSSMRLGNEDNFSSLKHSLAQMRTETQNAFKQLSGGPTLTTSTGPAEPPSAPRTTTTVAPPPLQGYVTLVEGDTVMVDLGSSQGVRQGSRLAVFKANDPNTRVGVIEVTQVVDAGSSRAKVITMNSGVRPEFSDIVRVE